MKDLIEGKINYFKKLRVYLKNRTKNITKNRLEVKKKKNGFEYYRSYKDPKTGEIKKKYIKKGEVFIASRIAQKNFDLQALNIVEKSLKSLKDFMTSFPFDGLEVLYQNLHPGRKILVHPIELSDREKIMQWMEKPFSTNPYPIYSNLITDRGEHVRSKSEKIMADKFNKLGIAYKYECYLQLKDGSIVYPDFTFYNPRTGKEIYWEHHGLMGDSTYAKKASNKIEAYQLNGIFFR